MKTKVFILILVVFGLTFSSCKKYEDGPLLSLKSKNSRLIGEWKLVSYSYVRTTDTETTTRSYDGTTMMSQDYNYLYNHTLVIDKDGTYTYKESTEGDSDEYTSYWSWSDGAKGKEQITLYDEGLFIIKKLTNKELIIAQNYSWKDYDGNSTTPTDYSNTAYSWTYEKQ